MSDNCSKEKYNSKYRTPYYYKEGSQIIVVMDNFFIQKTMMELIKRINLEIYY